MFPKTSKIEEALRRRQNAKAAVDVHGLETAIGDALAAELIDSGSPVNHLIKPATEPASKETPVEPRFLIKLIQCDTDYTLRISATTQLERRGQSGREAYKWIIHNIRDGSSAIMPIGDFHYSPTGQNDEDFGSHRDYKATNIAHIVDTVNLMLSENNKIQLADFISYPKSVRSLQ